MDKGEVASALGINLKVLFTGVFVLGAFVAGLSGLMGSKITGVKLGNGWEILLFSLIVVVVGGAGSMQGALLGGVLAGSVGRFRQGLLSRGGCLPHVHSPDSRPARSALRSAGQEVRSP